MKLLQTDKTLKKRTKTPFGKPKNGLFSYASYLHQRKATPYNISYQAFVAYCLKAKNFVGKPSNNLLLLLEHRLDTVLYRVRFCRSLANARQLIIHQKILVNGQVMALPSYHVKPGDIIELKKYLLAPTLCTWSSTVSVVKNIFKKKQAVKKEQTKKPKMFKKAFRRNARTLRKMKRPAFLFRPLHFEVNLMIGRAIFLYSPQKLYFSQRLHVDLIRRSFKRTL